ncbi:Ribosomal protein S12 methylthiotransferase RimO [compost metagenome]
MKNQIVKRIKQKRLKDLLEIQKNISLNNNKKLMGNEYEVLIEDVSEDSKYFICRSYMDAPDVDGRIYLEITEDTSDKIIVGDFATVKIIDYSEYDLFAKLV